MRRTPLIAAIGTLLVMLLSGVAPAKAHDYAPDPFGMTLGQTLQLNHGDGDPWAGWVNLTVTNTGTEAWGDFHFEIKEIQGFGSVEKIDWLSDSPYAPISSQSGLTWGVDNLAVGAMIDLFFYSDPVRPGETATFSVYNVNPDKRAFFGVCVYPTPVPVPAAAWLLGSGLIALVSRPRKKQ